ncbi:MAG: hypothetical protein KC425_07545, partial [Anaerolineales bacterium]|nr:hypothetical protein [Anaerolineales bacterium]
EGDDYRDKFLTAKTACGAGQHPATRLDPKEVPYRKKTTGTHNLTPRPAHPGHHNHTTIQLFKHSRGTARRLLQYAIRNPQSALPKSEVKNP